MSLKHPLPGVPRVESPFAAEIFDALQVDSAVRTIADQLHFNGYATFRFPDDEFDARAERIRNALWSRYDWAAWRASRASLRVQDAWKDNDDVRAVAVNPGILSLLQVLYGRNPWPFQTLNFPVGTEQHFHSDSVHFSSVPERFMCGVWVALEDVKEEGGPLCYFPGSHRWPICTNEAVGHADHLSPHPTTQEVYHQAWRNLVRIHRLEKRLFLAKRGDALIWAANLLHGGEPHLDRSVTRWSQVTHYYFDDCCYYTPMLSDPFLGKIAFREPMNICTGETQHNTYHGIPIPPQFLTTASRGYLPRVPPPKFDGASYLAANPDVAAAGADPWEHYLRHGRAEGRRLRP